MVVFFYYGLHKTSQHCTKSLNIQTLSDTVFAERI